MERTASKELTLVREPEVLGPHVSGAPHVQKLQLPAFWQIEPSRPAREPLPRSSQPLIQELVLLRGWGIVSAVGPRDRLLETGPWDTPNAAASSGRGREGACGSEGASLAGEPAVGAGGAVERGGWSQKVPPEPAREGGAKDPGTVSPTAP